MIGERISGLNRPKPYTFEGGLYAHITEPQQYPSHDHDPVFGDRIVPATRDNFMSWFIYSFQISRGSLNAQETYFQWFQANSGFDYKAVFRNYKQYDFEDTRAWYVVFSPAERKLFREQYEAERVHGKKVTIDQVIKAYGYHEDLLGVLFADNVSKLFDLSLREKGIPLLDEFKNRDLFGMPFAELDRLIYQGVMRVRAEKKERERSGEDDHSI